MSKRKVVSAGLLAVLVLGSFIYWRSRGLTAEPVFRLVYGAQNNPVDGEMRTPLPNKGYLHASVAVDQSGNFYILSSKRNTTTEVPGVPPSAHLRRVADEYVRAQQNVVHVLVVDALGQFKRAVPLRRLDGRLVRSSCEFLAVSASGENWWTLRQARESPEDWKDIDEVRKRTVLLNLYDGKGKALGEWLVPTPYDSSVLELAANEKEAYVSLEDTPRQLLIYSLGLQQPQQRSCPGQWQPRIGGSLVTSDSQFWHLQAGSDGSVEAYVTELDKPSRLFTKFQWHGKGSYPYLFWHDSKAGLFGFEHLTEYEPRSTPPEKLRSDGGKAVYRIDADGVVHKLFETMNVVQARRGEQVRTGQFLKADGKFVWMEVEYYKDNKRVEYQIVKVPY